MNLEIQLISKPEMTVPEAAAYLVGNFPHDEDVPLLMAHNTEKGTVLLGIEQQRLTDAQRDWLHLSEFAARYIDSYRVMPEDEFWTLKAAAEMADRTWNNLSITDLDSTREITEALWFQTMVLARTGEQVERVASALERIAAVMEANHHA